MRSTYVQHTSSPFPSNGVALPPPPPPPPAMCAASQAPVWLCDEHAGGDCGGSALVTPVNTFSSVNCDRQYTFGQGYQRFFDEHPGPLYLVQDAHDPNDLAFAHNRLATVHTQSAGMVIHLFVPLGAGGSSQAGHAHTASDLPNAIDPLGGLVDTGETFFEDNCIERKRYRKEVMANQYTLMHTTHLVRLPAITRHVRMRRARG